MKTCSPGGKAVIKGFGKKSLMTKHSHYQAVFQLRGAINLKKAEDNVDAEECESEIAPSAVFAEWKRELVPPAPHIFIMGSISLQMEKSSF